MEPKTPCAPCASSSQGAAMCPVFPVLLQANQIRLSLLNSQPACSFGRCDWTARHRGKSTCTKWEGPTWTWDMVEGVPWYQASSSSTAE